jgi:hypothetical protein
LGLSPCSRTWRLSSTRPTGRVFCRVDHQASLLAACAAASVTPEEEAGAAVPRVVCLPAFKRAARAAFPSGDLPEAPGGQPCPREGGGAALSRVAMAPVNYFPPPPPIAQARWGPR